jgi:hypothetical protein
VPAGATSCRQAAPCRHACAAAAVDAEQRTNISTFIQPQHSASHQDANSCVLPSFSVQPGVPPSCSVPPTCCTSWATSPTRLHAVCMGCRKQTLCRRLLGLIVILKRVSWVITIP